MKEYAEKLYKNKAWQNCRESYAKSVGYMCEDCMRHGISKAGDIVHHIKHISPQNITNPEITLDWRNLELLCRDCHARKHDKRAHRFRVDEFGNVETVGK